MFKHLSFGISSAQDDFQATISKDIEGVEVIVDDILVWRASEEKHDSRLEQVFEHAQFQNLKLNKDKSQIKLTEISFIGHILSHQGIKSPKPSLIVQPWTKRS